MLLLKLASETRVPAPLWDFCLVRKMNFFFLSSQVTVVYLESVGHSAAQDQEDGLQNKSEGANKVLSAPPL